MPDGGGGGVGGDGALVQWQGSGSSAQTGNSESEDSSISGSDPLSDKAIRCGGLSDLSSLFYFEVLIYAVKLLT